MADLGNFVWPKILYNPQENPKGIVTSDEWNRVFSLILGAISDTVGQLSDNWEDLATYSKLSKNWSNSEDGPWGTDFIGAPPIQDITGTNLTALLQGFYQKLIDVTLGQIPDGSISGAKLSDPFNYTGPMFSWNGNKILTEVDVQSAWPELALLEDDKSPSTKLTKNTLDTKQQLIEVGVTMPTQDTVGNIYIQYFVEN